MAGEVSGSARVQRDCEAVNRRLLFEGVGDDDESSGDSGAHGGAGGVAQDMRDHVNAVSHRLTRMQRMLP